MNRERLKQAIKKLVIQEITNNQLGVPIHTQKKDVDAEKKLQSAMGKDAAVHDVEGTGKTSGRTEEQEVQLSKTADDRYDVVSITNESERKIARGISLDDAIEMVKKHAKDSEKTYVQKAYDKSLRGFGKEVKETKKDEKPKDSAEETEMETQKEIGDDNTVKADEKADKSLSPINKEISLALGGDIVDKIEKIIDKVLKDKNKAEPSTSYLKHDKDVESPNKLTTKLKDTPALKEKKS